MLECLHTGYRSGTLPGRCLPRVVQWTLFSVQVHVDTYLYWAPGYNFLYPTSRYAYPGTPYRVPGYHTILRFHTSIGAQAKLLLLLLIIIINRHYY
jgi:hypothetical protein